MRSHQDKGLVSASCRDTTTVNLKIMFAAAQISTHPLEATYVALETGGGSLEEPHGLAKKNLSQ